MDEIERIRSVREAMWASCGHDIEAMAAMLRRRQEEERRGGRRVLGAPRNAAFAGRHAVADDEAEYGGSGIR